MVDLRMFINKCVLNMKSSCFARLLSKDWSYLCRHNTHGWYPVSRKTDVLSLFSCNQLKLSYSSPTAERRRVKVTFISGKVDQEVKKAL